MLCDCLIILNKWRSHLITFYVIPSREKRHIPKHNFPYRFENASILSCTINMKHVLSFADLNISFSLFSLRPLYNYISISSPLYLPPFSFSLTHFLSSVFFPLSLHNPLRCNIATCRFVLPFYVSISPLIIDTNSIY